jgi:hydroxysqualene dehydroxylase
LDHHALRIHLMRPTMHWTGGGHAGLAAAVDLAGRGVASVVHDATDQTGWSCDDAHRRMRIGNGTPILPSSNKAALGFVARLGGAALVHGAPAPRFSLSGLSTKGCWTRDLATARLPLGIFDRRHRAPGYLALAWLMWPASGQALGQAFGQAFGQVMSCTGPACHVMRPVLFAALNTQPSAASSDLVRAVIASSIARSGGACRPHLTPHALDAVVIEPAIAHLKKNGGVLHFRHELRRHLVTADIVSGSTFAGAIVPVGSQDVVAPAVPSYAARSIIPELQAPDEFRAIVNAHFRSVPPPRREPMLGILNGTAEWIFLFEDRISATISGADRFMQYTKDELARLIWQDASRVADSTAVLPPWHGMHGRRATFAVARRQNAKRPGVRMAWRHLARAGDRTDSGLPATIESAVRSGTRAAASVTQS